MPPARAEAGPVASLPVARKRGCLPFQRPGCRARLLGRPGALQRLPLRLRLVTAYPQGCCDPWGPRSCAACATASGGGVARPRSPEPGRRRSPRRCADPGRGGRARRATPTRPCRPESAAWCGGWSWDASPRSWFGFQRQRYARTRPSGPHPQCVGGTGRVPLEESRSQRRWRSSSLPGAVAPKVMAWPCCGAPLDAWRPRSCACGATAWGPWRATAQPRPPAHARTAQRYRCAGPDSTLRASWLAGLWTIREFIRGSIRESDTPTGAVLACATSLCRVGLVGARALVGAVALALHEHVVGAVDQAVQDPLGHDRVGEQPIPVGRCPVAGQDHGAGLVALADQLEEVVAALGSELAQAEVVQDQQVEPGQLADPGLPGVVGVAAGQLGQQPAGLGEADRMPLAAGGMPQGLGDMGLADTDGAVEDHRLPSLDVVAGGQVADLGCGELGVEGEVEVLQGGRLLEAGAADPFCERLGLAAVDLVLA